MHRLTGGRFTLGLGRGVDAMFGVYGLPKITTAQMEDIAGLHAPAVARRGRLRPRRPRRPLPAAAPRRRPSTRTSRSDWWPSDRTPWPWPAGPSTWWCCTPSSPTRRRRGRRDRAPAAEKAGRNPARCGSGPATPRSPTGSRGPAPEEDRRPPGHLPPGLRRPDGLDQRLGSRRPGPLPGRRDRPVGARRHRRRGRHGDVGAHRDVAARRVAGTRRLRRCRHVCRPRAAPVRPRRRRRDHARRDAGRAGAGRRGLPLRRARRAVSRD